LNVRSPSHGFDPNALNEFPIQTGMCPAIETQSDMTALKAFLVEDSAVIRENLIAALEELAPVQVVGTAEDEPSAMVWLGSADNHCDLVIIDIFLKRGSGLGVLRAARQLHESLALIVLSNYATPDMRRKCLALGANRVFDKSNEIDALLLYCARLAGGETLPGALSPLF
jgi:DNA-binding NarL/FixJ family response regulator